MKLEQTGQQDVEQIHLAQDTDQQHLLAHSIKTSGCKNRG